MLGQFFPVFPERIYIYIYIYIFSLGFSDEMNQIRLELFPKPDQRPHLKFPASDEYKDAHAYTKKVTMTHFSSR